MANDLLIWVRMVSFTSLFVATVLGFLSYRQQPYRWLKSFLIFLAAQAFFDLVYTYAIIRHLYLPTQPSLAGSVGGAIYLILNGAAEIVILYAAPMFILRVTGRPAKWVSRAVLVPAIVSSMLTISINWVSDPGLWSRVLNVCVYTYLTGWFAFGVFRRRNLPGAPWGGSITLFLFVAVAWHSLVALDSAIARIPLPTTPPVAISALTSSLFNIFWAVIVIIPVMKQLRSATLIGRDADAPIPAAFVQEYGLTQRECEIVTRICRGASTREIAGELFISPRTVDTHIQNIHRKCDVGRRVELIGLVQRYS